MNKKAQLGDGVMFLVIIFVMIMLWIYLVHPVIEGFVPAAVSDNNVTGLEAYLWNNLNLAFFVTLFLFTIAYAAFLRSKNKQRFAG